MNNKDTVRTFLADNDIPLPLHLSLMQETPQSRFSERYTQSQSMRASRYLCYFFYKHISRPLARHSQGDSQ
jgi:hypothetical protein